MPRRLLPAMFTVVTIAVLAWGLALRAPPSPDIDAFLAAHWREPLPPQGEPPARFSPVEASLAPEACGQCHAQQLRDWQSSLHSRSVGPGILWQFTLMQQNEANACMRCHAPLAEQKALLARERGWPGPSSAPPAYVPPDLHTSGLVCAACHVRSHRRFGPQPSPEKSKDGPEDKANRSALPHGGFTANEAFSDSRFCATCHQFPESGRRLNGKLLENTYEEWRASSYGAEGKPCQSCHMPDRRHLWRGIHDPDMTQRALDVELRTEPVAGDRHAVAVIANRGAGHYFPTYLVPRIEFLLEAIDAAGKRSELASIIVARETNVELTHELADTRIAPGGEIRLHAPIPPGSDKLRLRMRVAPGAHYERLYAHMLKNRATLAPPTLILLEQAAARARALHYDIVLADQAL